MAGRNFQVVARHGDLGIHVDVYEDFDYVAAFGALDWGTVQNPDDHLPPTALVFTLSTDNVVVEVIEGLGDFDEDDHLDVWWSVLQEFRREPPTLAERRLEAEEMRVWLSGG